MLHGYICEYATVNEDRPVGSLSDWLAQHSELSPLYADFRQSFGALSQLPADVLRLCRIRMAQLHSLPTNSGDAAVGQELAKAVSLWSNNSQFSSSEKACLAFAEVYAIDVHAITDAQADAVKEYFGEPGLVALVQALGVFYAEVRLCKLWGFADIDQAEQTQ
ncbi:MAG: hypothetical protein AB8B48_17760 [Pseudomonadales bacterium]